jgi:ribosomal protein L34E
MTTQKARNCAMCSGAYELKKLPAASGEEGPLKITVRDMPVLECPKHHRAPVHRDFMIWLIQEIRAREAQFAAGKVQGMLFKKHRCGECGEELASKPERRQAFPFELKYEDTESFKAEIEIPLFKCARCGKEQIRSVSDLHNHVPGAMIGVNDGAGFPHSG